jgi:hypothetical protein
VQHNAARGLFETISSQSAVTMHQPSANLLRQPLSRGTGLTAVQIREYSAGAGRSATWLESACSAS